MVSCQKGRLSKILALLLVFALFIGPAVSDEMEDLMGIELDARVYKSIAETMFMQRKVLEYTEKKFGMDSVESLKSLEALAWMNTELGNFENAELYYRRAIKVRTKKMPETPENTAKLATNYFLLGDTFLYRKLYFLAEEKYDNSLNIAVDPGHRGDAFNRKAMIHKWKGDPEKTLRYYLEAIEAYKSAGASKQVKERMLKTYRSILDIYQKMKEYEKVQEYQDLIWIMEAQQREEGSEEK